MAAAGGGKDVGRLAPAALVVRPPSMTDGPVVPVFQFIKTLHLHDQPSISGMAWDSHGPSQTEISVIFPADSDPHF